MAQRRLRGNDGTEFIGTPVKSVTAAQLEALRDVQAFLPQRLVSLSPILEEMLAAYEMQVPPHKRPVKVKKVQI